MCHFVQLQPEALARENRFEEASEAYKRALPDCNVLCCGVLAHVTPSSESLWMSGACAASTSRHSRIELVKGLTQACHLGLVIAKKRCRWQPVQGQMLSTQPLQVRCKHRCLRVSRLETLETRVADSRLGVGASALEIVAEAR